MQQIIADFGKFFGIPIRIYGYGLMMVLGFITAILLAQWRARKMGEDQESIMQIGIISLVGGIFGARLAFVIEQMVKHPEESWRDLSKILDVTSGGLIYFGGLILAALLVIAYLFVKRLPIRRYLDIVAPCLMIGLAFGRAGCLLNGCCYGGQCSPDWPLAQTFPMYSKPLIKLDGRENSYSEATSTPTAPYMDQSDKKNAVLPLIPDERMMCIVPIRVQNGLSTRQKEYRTNFIPPSELHGLLSNNQMVTMLLDDPQAMEKFKSLAAADGQVGRREWELGLKPPDGFLRGSEQWLDTLRFDSDENGRLNFTEMRAYLKDRLNRLTAKFDADGDRVLAGGELSAADNYLRADLLVIAASSRSNPVRPSQTLGIINGLLLGALLWFFTPLRSREGQVFALMTVMYPITRIVEESIRADNPHNLLAGVLTHNQYTSLVLATIGILMFIAFHRLAPSCGPVLAERLAAREKERKDK